MVVWHYEYSTLICSMRIIGEWNDRLVPSCKAQGRATFSERGSDETFRSSSWAGVSNKNPKMRMYIDRITILLFAKQANQ